MESSHLTSVPHWVNNNSLSKYLKSDTSVLWVYSKNVTDPFFKKDTRIVTVHQKSTSMTAVLFPSIVCHLTHTRNLLKTKGYGKKNQQISSWNAKAYICGAE